MFKRLVKKLRETDNWSKTDGTVTSPLFSEGESLKKLSKHALTLYERQTDINNFKKLVLSDPENKTHNEIVDRLFRNQGISNPFSDEALISLAKNKRFQQDLGL